jgi:hypothetical protein
MSEKYDYMSDSCRYKPPFKLKSNSNSNLTVPNTKLCDCKDIFDKCAVDWYYNQTESYNNCIKLFKECKKLIKAYRDIV